ncbi:MAG: restriction endonuclease subunit M [Methanobrevibacter olleyae]|uniref:site-specific DNA-methyltransferase (adenine-specific) n=1 Tax=Methanobrevibacter olleyae TaxID=294671 RepID=A0A8T3VZW5_METOL|nr:restriction endonuclease subunit M [Methanobrevibacter olleyae]
MSAPQKIIELVQDFEENKYEYINPDVFDEENTKVKFLNPFFEELGWNVRNEGLSAKFREVVFEDSIKVGRKTKAPDYSFRLGGERIFFVEAKKPSRDLSNDKEHAFQVRRYGWSAKLPLCILTDFEELAIYDTTIKPDKNQSATIGRIKYYKYTDYIDKWDEIYNIFSKEAVLSGKFDSYANNVKHDKKGTSEIDDEFLKEIEQWRLLLARNIALRNPELSIEDLNYAVQLTIDRIIFLRIAEDRGIERYGQLEKLLQKENIYKEFGKICKKADEKYNSGLFHFNPYDKEDFTTDTYTLDLTIDDNVFKEIFKNLYYPNSPYEFSLISTEILGKIYEQFLGKVIRLTLGHQAKVEDKPEVKKAGGVYYTPQYIVDYIVENTLGEKIKDKTPNQISKIRVIDPACGSGSFLIRAYQYLLDYHLDYYSNMTKPPKDVIYEDKKGIKHLTIREKKRILKNNIYGVDIDALAVEVTKLSLLLKVLEDQNKDLLESQQKLFHERVLPNLSSNIKTGNSLVNSNILLENLETEDVLHINPFDWEKEYEEIFEKGGFDVVIGNPPYLRIQGLREFFNYEIPFLKENYESAVKRFDLYVLFLEKGFNILKDTGILGYICPNKFINADFGSGIRTFLLNNRSLNKFISFSKEQIFDNATTYTSLVFLSHNNHNFEYYEYKDEYNNPKAFLNKINTIQCSSYNLDNLGSTPWKLLPQNIKKVLDSLENNSIKLGKIFENIFQGIVTGIDDIYFLKVIEEYENTVKAYSPKLNDYIKIEKNILKPILKGEDVSKYSEPIPQYYCIYPYLIIDGKTKIMEEKYLKNNYPLAYSYLKQFKRILIELRKKFKTNVQYWYSCHRPRNMTLFEKDKILTPEISLGCNMTFSNIHYYHNTKVYSLVIPENSPENKFYWLGLFNSKVLWWFISNTGYVLRGGYYSFSTKYLKEFPVPKLDLNNQNVLEIHDNIVNNVKKQLELYQKINNSKTPNEMKILKNQIEFNENSINQLVYKLYNLTEEEIDIIENSL